jgi:hypothetical protein
MLVATSLALMHMALVYTVDVPAWCHMAIRIVDPDPISSASMTRSAAVTGTRKWSMSDDLFEFLAAQKAGRATQEAERAAKEAQRFPPKCVNHRQDQREAQLWRTAEVRACQPDECDWAPGDYTTQLDPMSRYETVLLTDMLFRRSAVLLV